MQNKKSNEYSNNSIYARTGFLEGYLFSLTLKKSPIIYVKSMEIIIIFFLILLNGVFAMSEIAIVSSRRARLEEAAKKGSVNAKIALDLSQEPEEFLSTVQVGITLVGIISGVYGGVALAEDLVPVIERISFLKIYSSEVSYFLIIAIITYFSLIIGELVPKTVAMNNPEKIAIFMAPIIKYLTKAAYPVIYLLSLSTKLFIKLFGIKEANNPPVTEDELKMLIDQGASFGSIEKKEGEMIKRIFKFGDRKASSIMTPSHNIVWLDINDTPEEIRKTITSTKFSVYPLCEKHLDAIIGIVYLKDYYKYPGKEVNLREIVKEPVYVPYNISSIKLIERIKETGIYNSIVMDEYGTIRGMITLKDIIENIIGDLPEYGVTEEQQIIKREDGSYLVDGDTMLDDLLEVIDLKISDYEKRLLTISAYIIQKLDRMPSTGDKIKNNSHSLEIIDMDGNRIDKILITRSQ